MTPKDLIDELNQNGVTRYKIAQETGLSQSTVMRIKAGTHSLPKPETALKLKELRDRLRKERKKEKSLKVATTLKSSKA